MSNRTRLCNLRARLESLAIELREAEAELPSRNAQHELGRAASMAVAAGEFVTRALGHHVDGAGAESAR